MDYKIAGEDELERRKRLGITDAPPLLPHPDDIKLDLRAGTARIVGPMTKEENVVYDLWVAQKQALLAKIESLAEQPQRFAPRPAVSWRSPNRPKRRSGQPLYPAASPNVRSCAR